MSSTPKSSTPKSSTTLPHVSWRDIGTEASAGVLARPLRAALTATGTIIGIAALIATIGISRTASTQIVGRIDDLQSLQVTVEAPAPADGGIGLPWDAQQRMERLNGVAAAGAMAPLPSAERTVRYVDVDDPLSTSRFTMDIVATTSGVFSAVDGVLSSGRFLTPIDDAKGYPVAVLGAGAARRLGVTDVTGSPAVFVGDEPLTVVGVLAEVGAEPGLLNAVMVTPATARTSFGVASPTRVVLRATRGAVALVASQAPLALDPGRAVTGLVVKVPPDPRSLRQAVQGDLNGLLLLLGLLSLLIGAIGIANVTLVTVMERTYEIGLRRALGATKAKIAAQILLESMLLGTVGGIIGASLGVLMTVGTAAMHQWTPVLEPIAPLASVPIGALIGLAAGLYPAMRAARMEPSEALRA